MCTIHIIRKMISKKRSTLIWIITLGVLYFVFTHERGVQRHLSRHCHSTIAWYCGMRFELTSSWSWVWTVPTVTISPPPPLQQCRFLDLTKKKSLSEVIKLWPFIVSIKGSPGENLKNRLDTEVLSCQCGVHNCSTETVWKYNRKKEYL